MSSAEPDPPAVSLDPGFKLVLLIVTTVTFLSLVIMVALAITDATNDASNNLFGVCEDAFKVGFGAIVGLLGGKAL